MPFSFKPTRVPGSLGSIALSPSDTQQPRGKKRKFKDFGAVDDVMQEAKINVVNHKSLYVASQLIRPTADQTRSKTRQIPRTIPSEVISARELHWMSNTLQNFQRRFKALSQLSEKLLSSETLKPGEIHSIISRLARGQFQSGEIVSGAKMEYDLPARSETALRYGSIAKQINLYFKVSTPKEKVEDREGFIKLFTMFMENYVAFKGCIEILLTSAENISPQAKSVQGAVDTFSHSHLDTSKNGSQTENPSTISDTVAFFDVMDTSSSKNEHTEDQDHQAHSSDSSESDSEMIWKMLVPKLK
ncbi:uncharacterized protein MELLADRAFT_67381 [Melampsora larici-populina 98AG31]|uniref:Uncharacterized protein n=1 Tax=Melampsora larici-populina (strain 98AG31 / pathotype 3-4-7) TaxID=747676 RepID=F4S2Y7_MELLP|nr:uncharacterized protein MELLADRAFT_67381 [Melampsora larici-populina 98AG31]EGG00997.1 hypothetical protein MELLADRAFT_67381 [Melampsora larici-populina 98AG31]